MYVQMQETYTKIKKLGTYVFSCYTLTNELKMLDCELTIKLLFWDNLTNQLHQMYVYK